MLQQFLPIDTVLGVPEIDRSHQVLMAELTRLDHATEQEVTDSYLALVAEVERDFRTENELMDGLVLTSLEAHREQHAVALGHLYHAVPQLGQGNVKAARKAIRLLLQWFIVHTGTMDKMLAEALLARAAGTAQRKPDDEDDAPPPLPG